MRRALARPLLASGLVTTGLLATSLAAIPAQADDAAPTFGGYSTSITATPLRVEVYEPTIPIPASPQLELSLSRTRVTADASSSKARASYLWPGDSVGDGLSTILEAFGLPQQLVDAVAADGYPVQATATQPDGTPKVVQEPVPGLQQRASATPEASTAWAGFTTDCDDACTLPAALSGVVGVGAVRGRARSAVEKGAAVGEADARLGQVSLAGGLITIDGVRATTEVANDGETITTSALSRVTGLEVAGQGLAIDADGVHLVGTRVGSLPASPAALEQALSRLGITLTAPRTSRTKESGTGEATAEGLVIELDAAVLRKALSPILPIDRLSDLIAGLPDGLGPVKDALSALPGLAPRLVVTLGSATTSVATSAVPTGGDDGSTPPGSDPGGASSGGDTGAGASSRLPDTGGGTAAASLGDLPGTSPVSAGGGPAMTDAGGVTPAAATPGLPPVGSIPFLLIVLAVGGAAGGGALLRRLGLAALGGGAPCGSGLERGLPNLRSLVSIPSSRT